ncbi:pentapeptide repeat-containing protein [Desulfogranum mediterraneum]|uniref:pentapeptide repeat-containing protein n=1 Tax=Desulfogranum mediterraneum TaxID=160661 RepID=UPI00040569DF|nr:pentapeptide repeat-containing protein [Desulfogranum mediterraneum]
MAVIFLSPAAGEPTVSSTPGRPMDRLLALSLICLFFLGCSPATVSTLVEQEGSRQLEAPEALKRVQANTLFLHSSDEDSYLFFAASGKLFARDIYANSDSGRWDLSEDGELCLQLSKWWYGDLRCFRLFTGRATDRLHLANSADVLEYSAQLLPGDDQELYRPPAPEKKSFRRSQRRKAEAAALQDKPPSIPPRSEPPPPAVTVRDNQPLSSHRSQKDHQATLQWMARDCPGCNLAGADLQQSALVAAQLGGADLKGANLRMANLRRADLSGADLRQARLTYANLPGANLQGADLRGADLHGANLIRADLRRARLEGADLSEALLEGAMGLQ